MLISELAKEVHENAVAPGWWDEEREAPEINALIHSEWSEALEEARAGRPLVWYACGEAENHTIPCNPKDDDECRMYGRESECQYRGSKPEGVAVELIDGCIRILDYMGRLKTEVAEREGVPSTIESLYTDYNVSRAPDKLPELISHLHMQTSLSIFAIDGKPRLAITPNMFALVAALAVALSWVKKQGLDPLAILMEKHEYNKGRPYKHGKRF